MTTKIKLAISEAQKAYTGQCEVSSDEMTEDEVHALSMRTAERLAENVALLNMKYKA